MYKPLQEFLQNVTVMLARAKAPPPHEFSTECLKSPGQPEEIIFFRAEADKNAQYAIYKHRLLPSKLPSRDKRDAGTQVGHQGVFVFTYDDAVRKINATKRYLINNGWREAVLEGVTPGQPATNPSPLAARPVLIVSTRVVENNTPELVSG